MHTTSDFARRKQAGNHFTIGADDLSLVVDLDTAHGVVNTGLYLDSIIRCLIQRIGKGHTAEVRIFFCLNAGVPFFHRCRKGFRRSSDCLGQCLIGIAGLSIALVDIALDNIRSIAHAAVHDQPGIAAGLLEFCRRDLVTGRNLVKEALALLVHQDCAVATETFRDQNRAASFHMDCRVKLNLLKINCIRAHCLGHLDALALDAGRIRGDEAVQLRPDGGDHLVVRAKPAGGDDNGFRIHGHFRSVRVLSHNANRLAAVHQDFLRGGVQQQLNPAGFQILLKQGDNIGAYRKGLALFVHRAVDTLDGRAAELRHVVEDHFRIKLTQEFNGALAALHELLYQRRVIHPAAANQSVKLEELFSIEIALRILLVGCPLLGHDRAQLLDALVVRVVCDLGKGALHTGALAELIGLLPLGRACVHASCGAYGVAAYHALTLQNQNILARIGCCDRGCHTGATCTDNNHIHIIDQILCFSCGFFSRLLCRGCSHIGFRIKARGFQRHLDRVADGRAGHGCSRDAVHIIAVRRDNRAGKLLHRNGANAYGLILLYNLNRIDGALVSHNLNLDFAIDAHACSGCGDLSVLANNRGCGFFSRGCLRGFFSRLFSCRCLIAKGSRINAACRHGIRNRIANRIGSNCRAAYRINREALCLHNRAGQLVNGICADAFCLIVVKHIHRIDLIRSCDDLDFYRAFLAFGRGCQRLGIGRKLFCSICRNDADNHDQNKKQATAYADQVIEFLFVHCILLFLK